MQCFAVLPCRPVLHRLTAPPALWPGPAQVVAQYGCWTAIVNLGGELYQVGEGRPIRVRMGRPAHGHAAS